MNAAIYGIGWLTSEGYGCIRSGYRSLFNPCGGDRLFKKNAFSHPFKNFGRLDPVSKMTAYAVALALQDAGIEYGPGKKQDLGIVTTNASGSLQADFAYFKDYVESGRTLSRGNLFIYTLPSSPAGEAAIHFGLRGPLLYVGGGDNSVLQALDTASHIVRGREAPAMLAGMAEPDEALFFVIGEAQSKPAFCSLAEAFSVVKADRRILEVVRTFEAVGKA